MISEKIMKISPAEFRKKIQSLIADWKAEGLPSRSALEAAGSELLQTRTLSGLPGLWAQPPLMATATIDDGLGQGLSVIQRFAEAVGVRIRPLGLMQTAASIIADCHKVKPEFLGLTVLQFDSEEVLRQIVHGVPSQTRLICGGPVFNADPDLAERCGVHFVARHVGAFLELLLALSQKK